MENASTKARPLQKMTEIELAVKLLACFKGGNGQGFTDARNEIVERGGKVPFNYEGPGAII